MLLLTSVYFLIKLYIAFIGHKNANNVHYGHFPNYLTAKCFPSTHLYVYPLINASPHAKVWWNSCHFTCSMTFTWAMHTGLYPMAWRHTNRKPGPKYLRTETHEGNWKSENIGRSWKCPSIPSSKASWILIAVSKQTF